MKTLNILISEFEFQKYNLKSENLSFTELVEIISREVNRQNLKNAVELSERFGISTMTMDEISKEINSVRENAVNSIHKYFQLYYESL